MQQFKYLIIGGGIAGTTAAETLRKDDAAATIAIVSDEPYPLYSRVLLSKPGFVRGEQSEESVWIKTQEWYDSNHISLFKGIAATALDSQEKKVSLSNNEELHYEKLLLATGAHSRKWTIPGSDKHGVFYMRTLDDAKSIVEAVKTSNHAVLIGSGFVSFELADILKSLNIKTTLVMREKYFGEPLLCEEEGKMIEKRLEEQGITIIRDTETTEVLGDANVTGLTLKDGTKLDCDIVLCMIGIVYPNDWLKTSGVALGRGILANEYLESNVPDVYVAGDSAEFNDVIQEETVIYGNWMNSRAQGETAAKNMLGQKVRFELVSFQSSHGFGDTIGFVGDVRNLPGRTSVLRRRPEENTSCRLLLSGGRIAGAVVINKTQEMGTITKLIKGKIDVSSKKEGLSNPDLDLKTLLPV